MANIHVFEQKGAPWFKQRRMMKAVLTELFAREKTPVKRVQFVFLSDPDLLLLNQSFLGHDTYTDIVTFDLGEPGAPKEAEIYISIDRVVENAENWNTTKINELRRVMFHGCLHLCGYKDKLKKDRALMREKEDFYLRLYAKRST